MKNKLLFFKLYLHKTPKFYILLIYAIFLVLSSVNIFIAYIFCIIIVLILFKVKVTPFFILLLIILFILRLLLLNTTVLNKQYSQNIESYANGYVIQNVRIDMPLEDRQILDCLIFGKMNYNIINFYEQSKEIGVAHVLVVSGYNITLLIIMLTALSFLINRKLIIILQIFVLLSYIYIIGIDNYPAFRAFLIGMIFLIFNLNGNLVKSKYMLLISFIFIEMIIPKSVQSISMQLTYSIIIANIILKDTLRAKLSNLLPEMYSESISVTIISSLVSIIIVSSFNTSFPLIAFITNLIFLPLTSLITIFGLFSYLFANLGILSIIIWKITEISIYIFKLLLELFSSFSFSSINIGRLGMLLSIMILFYIINIKYNIINRIRKIKLIY